MKILKPYATIEYLNTLNPTQLMNFWHRSFYHYRDYAIGKGSKRYIRELSCYASNLATYKNCRNSMYKDIADRIAVKAKNLLDKYLEV